MWVVILSSFLVMLGIDAVITGSTAVRHRVGIVILGVIAALIIVTDTFLVSGYASIILGVIYVTVVTTAMAVIYEMIEAEAVTEVLTGRGSSRYSNSASVVSVYKDLCHVL